MSRRERGDLADHVVVGRGLVGAAAARHLARAGAQVVLVGPEEPEDPDARPVVASHHDEGRITRVLDPDPTWALLARRSLARYRAIEAASGVPFFHQVGHLRVVAADDPQVERVQRVADDLGVACTRLDHAGIAARFPAWSFERAVVGFHQATQAGHVSARGQVRAQARAAARDGARLVRAMAVDLAVLPDRVEVALDDGGVVAARRALVATGAATVASGLVPGGLDLEVRARTVVLVRLDAVERDRLAALPSLIHRPADPADGCYLLPPIRYPDGNSYLKIGGPTDDRVLATRADLDDWFRGDGDERAAALLRERLHRLVPGLRAQGVVTRPCATTHTAGGYPVVDLVDDRVAVAVGGNGAAAKSADEIGRMAALLVRHGRWTHDLPAEAFRARPRRAGT